MEIPAVPVLKSAPAHPPKKRSRLLMNSHRLLRCDATFASGVDVGAVTIGIA